MKIPQRWRMILEGALRSPSPHNTQPWRLRVVDPQRAVLYLDRDRLLPHEDLTGCFQVAAAGIFIEAVSLLAAGQGCDLDVNLREIDLSQPMIDVADLTLIADGSLRSMGIDAERLAARRTSRLPHTGERITDGEAEAFARLAEASGQRFGYTADAAKIEQVLARNTQAVFEDMNEQAYHDEFVGWLRTKQQAKLQRDGLELECMRMSRGEQVLLRRGAWVLKVPGCRGVLAKRYRQTLGRTDGVGWLSGPFWDYTKAIGAGRFLLRFWLAMDAEGVSMHPFGNLVTNDAANQWVTETLVKDEGVWMVFRFGRTAAAPPSCRLRLEEVLLD